MMRAQQIIALNALEKYLKKTAVKSYCHVVCCSYFLHVRMDNRNSITSRSVWD
jgi:hypothetical protein